MAIARMFSLPLRHEISPNGDVHSQDQASHLADTSSNEKRLSLRERIGTAVAD